MRNLLLIFTFVYFTTSVCFGVNYFNNSSHSSSDSIQISLLTYSPGKEIYSMYGHSSIRVQNKIDDTDIVYNYGTFDFDQPYFYWHFMQGNLNYKVSISSFRNELWHAEHDNISLVETPLILTQSEEKQLIRFLQHNLLPENKYYRYDFLYDNCATKIIDILEENICDSLILRPEVVPLKTFRHYIHQYTHVLPWAELGIDILMGAPADKYAVHTEPAFLPDYLHLILKNYHTSTPPRNRSITEADILLHEAGKTTKSAKLKPALLFFLLSILMLLSALVDSYFKKTFVVFGNWFMLIVGIVSLLLIYLWAGTNHYIFKWNADMLWANPLLVILFLLRNNNGNFKHVLGVVSLILCIVGAIASYYIQDSAATSAIAMVLTIHLYFNHQLPLLRAPRKQRL